MLIVVIPSCKKGEEDPYISLRSRESRLKNSWILQTASVEITETYYDGSVITHKEEYDGTKAVVTHATPNEITVNNCYYSLEYKFGKHHTYESKYVETNPQEPEYYFELNEEGRWEFLSKSKSLDIKNKEQLALIPMWQYNSTEVTDTDFPTIVWTIVKLSNKELKIKIEVENSTSISGYTYSKDAEYTFKAN